jgi:hypothetical protein
MRELMRGLVGSASLGEMQNIAKMTVASEVAPAAAAAASTVVATHAGLTSGIHGLGSMSQQSAAAVNITGGSISGITDLAVADGGTGAGDAAGARFNLGLGTADTPKFKSVQVSDPELSELTSLDAGKIRYRETANESRADMVMKIGPTEYAWVSVMVNNWQS